MSLSFSKAVAPSRRCKKLQIKCGVSICPVVKVWPASQRISDAPRRPLRGPAKPFSPYSRMITRPKRRIARRFDQPGIGRPFGPGTILELEPLEYGDDPLEDVDRTGVVEAPIKFL